MPRNSKKATQQRTNQRKDATIVRNLVRDLSEDPGTTAKHNLMTWPSQGFYHKKSLPLRPNTKIDN